MQLNAITRGDNLRQRSKRLSQKDRVPVGLLRGRPTDAMRENGPGDEQYRTRQDRGDDDEFDLEADAAGKSDDPVLRGGGYSSRLKVRAGSCKPGRTVGVMS